MQTQQRRLLLATVAAAVPPAAGEHLVRVGIDGVDGAGKTVFADQLARVLRAQGRPVVRLSLDRFHHPAAIRYTRGRRSPGGFWLDSYDYVAFRREVLAPLGPGGSRRYRSGVHDLRSDRRRLAPLRQAPAGAVLVVDGLFLHRDELAGCWDLSVFLHVPFEVSFARLAARDGTDPHPAAPANRRYREGQRLYLRTCEPGRRASLVVDNSDPAAPRLLEARPDSSG